jgi:hypothetical protein
MAAKKVKKLFKVGAICKQGMGRAALLELKMVQKVFKQVVHECACCMV